MFNPPLLPGMPDFHDSVEYLRHHRNLSRESTAQKAGFSSSYLNQLIGQRKTPGTAVFDKLVEVFGLDLDPCRHLEALLQPSGSLESTDELRRRLVNHGVQAHLDWLDQREILGAYTDPLQTVLLANQVLHRMMPGLADCDYNIIRWMLTPIARDRVYGWHGELLDLVRHLRVALGRYRDDPRAQELFRTLRTDLAFRNAWDGTPMQVAYTWPRTPPMRLRIPGMNRPLSLNLEVNEYGACSELFIVHGTYNPCAIAC
ncbi:helix-turn-helix domain-containing protein [Nocardia salmonicida]